MEIYQTNLIIKNCLSVVLFIFVLLHLHSDISNSVKIWRDVLGLRFCNMRRERTECV